MRADFWAGSRRVCRAAGWGRPAGDERCTRSFVPTAERTPSPTNYRSGPPADVGWTGTRTKTLSDAKELIKTARKDFII